jgi:hypothetical protein
MKRLQIVPRKLAGPVGAFWRKGDMFRPLIRVGANCERVVDEEGPVLRERLTASSGGADMDVSG